MSVTERIAEIDRQIDDLVKEKNTILLKTGKYHTIKDVVEMNEIKGNLGMAPKLSNACKKMKMKPVKVPDIRFGHINAYHEDVWSELYPELCLAGEK